MKNSDLIFARLVEHASQFSFPDKRLATLDRLKNACDLIASGEHIPVEPGEKFSSRKITRKINPSNIERVVRSKSWTGPTRSFIANKANGLIEYVNAREEERSAKTGTKPKTLPSQLESYLSEIESVEIRQIMRNEVEKRRIAEQEVRIIKEGLRKLPQVDVRELLKGPVTMDKMVSATAVAQNASSDELMLQVRNFINRLTKGDLRRLGLKWDGEDIVAMTNAPVILSSELRALVEVVGLPSSLLKPDQSHGKISS